ncbi:MAG: DUF4332 domain-containing protein [Euryarchaeota archaeon]|jgi:predicted flap endonuclease-1-like 5' DNA nuclease|nr:DUF4332 domain-containing protein [Euryarchaeota archaeon]
MTRVVEIEGVGAASAQRLDAVGTKTVEALLDKGATTKGRKEIAEKSGISEKLILEWVNRADLSRVSGVGGQYSNLLEAAGADTVPELAARNAANLCKKLEEVNTAKKLVRKLPTEAQVADWIAQAKKLPRMVSH